MTKEAGLSPDQLAHLPLYSEDLAPVPPPSRTWTKWNLAALWVGMAVCIPTYLLASYMIKSGLSWQESLIIIALANVVITVPMVLNGHAGVKYGIPFPVVGRSAFGTQGIHIPSVMRALVACGWFGIQTWIGGLSIYSIANVIMGTENLAGLSWGKFLAFGVFWVINIYFIWKGTESIKWLEDYSAPVLILVGILLIYWGSDKVGSFGKVLQKSEQLQSKTAMIDWPDQQAPTLWLHPLRDADGNNKVSEYQLWLPVEGQSELKQSAWQTYEGSGKGVPLSEFGPIHREGLVNGTQPATIQFRTFDTSRKQYQYSSKIPVTVKQAGVSGNKIADYILWFTAMVGFWATMAISISDITRFSKSQKDQMLGQFIGLPGTMVFYSFVGIFVTAAAALIFPDVLIAEDAPWDPVTLVAKFNNPLVVIFAQVSLLIATLSTNIAANIIAPAYAISNLFPKQVSFRAGGVIAGLIGILACPWWLMNEISNVLLFVSGLLGPILGILLCDYFLIRNKQLYLVELYKTDGLYAYGGSGFNRRALLALGLGVALPLLCANIPSLRFLFLIAWFTGFFCSFGLYYLFMKVQPTNVLTEPLTVDKIDKR